MKVLKNLTCWLKFVLQFEGHVLYRTMLSRVSSSEWSKWLRFIVIWSATYKFSNQQEKYFLLDFNQEEEATYGVEFLNVHVPNC